MKEQDKTAEELRKVEVSCLPTEEFKVMIIENGNPFLIPDLRGNAGNAFSFSPLKIMFAMGLSYRTFTILK